MHTCPSLYTRSCLFTQQSAKRSWPNKHNNACCTARFAPPIGAVQSATNCRFLITRTLSLITNYRAADANSGSRWRRIDPTDFVYFPICVMFRHAIGVRLGHVSAARGESRKLCHYDRSPFRANGLSALCRLPRYKRPL